MKIAELDRVVNAAKKHQELLKELQASEEALDELKSALADKVDRRRDAIEEDESHAEEADALYSFSNVLESDAGDLLPEELEKFRTASWWEE